MVELANDGRVTGFQEKPKKTDLRSPYNPQMISASMGVYLFNTDVLIPALLKDAEDMESRHDFGYNILPRMIDDYKVYSFNFVDENHKEALYWRDVGTLEAYYEANMDVASVSPVFNLYDQSWPIRGYQRQYPPAKFVFAEPGRTGTAVDSVISQGCIISGGTVRTSVLSPDVRVNSYAEVDSSICSATSILAATAASAKPSSIATSSCRKEPSSAMTRRPTARSTSSPRAASPSSPVTTRSLRARSPWTTTPATKLSAGASEGPEASFRAFAFASSPVRCLQFRTTGDSVRPAW